MSGPSGTLQGRVAFITGAARGQGRAHAARLAREGADIIALDICAPVSDSISYPAATPEDLADTVRAVEAEGRKVLARQVDIRDDAAVRQLVSDGVEQFGRLDILVANAGVLSWGRIWELSDEQWNTVIDVNLTGTFLTCRAVVPGMQQRGYGRIVNIASIAGKEGNPNACAYSASKAGVISLTKSLGKELATAGVCVNCITPAVIQTEMLKQSTQAHIDYMVSKIPMGRLGQVDEIAALVCWLASAECSFSTGAVFDISGGRATY